LPVTITGHRACRIATNSFDSSPVLIGASAALSKNKSRNLFIFEQRFRAGSM